MSRAITRLGVLYINHFTFPRSYDALCKSSQVCISHHDIRRILYTKHLLHARLAMPAAQTRTGSCLSLQRCSHCRQPFHSFCFVQLGINDGSLSRHSDDVRRMWTQSPLFPGGPLDADLYNLANRGRKTTDGQRTVYPSIGPSSASNNYTCHVVPHLVAPDGPPQRVSFEHGHTALLVTCTREDVLSTRTSTRLTVFANRNISIPLFTVDGHPHPQRWCSGNKRRLVRNQHDTPESSLSKRVAPVAQAT